MPELGSARGLVNFFFWRYRRVSISISLACPRSDPILGGHMQLLYNVQAPGRVGVQPMNLVI